MIEEPFSQRDSAIHRRDPRLRVLLAALFSAVVAVASRWPALAAALVLALLLFRLANLPLRQAAGRLLLVNVFLLLLWLFLPFVVEGRPLFAVGPFTASREGVLYAALLTLRSNTILLALMSLVATIPMFDLGRALQQLRVPGKLVQLLLFTYRYLHVMQSEHERLLRTLKIRGFQPASNLHTYRSYAYLIALLLVRSFDRSVRVQQAMRCRGFEGRFYNLVEFSIRPADLFALAALAAALAVIAVLQWSPSLS